MKVTLLGTGCPQCDTERLGPASLVRHGASSVLVDCGSGVTQRLLGAGSAGPAIDALLVTHLHTDHVIDFYQLVVSAWHQGRDRPWRVLGPRGTRAFVERTMALWREEREMRVAHERRPSTAGLEVAVEEVAPGAAIEIGALRARAVEVDHRPVRAAFGYAFEAAGERAVLSGDTRRSAAIVDAARGADLLVHECFVHREMRPAPGMRTREGIDAVASYHTLSSEVGKIAAQAGVGVLALNHFVPARVDRDALLAEVARDFHGTILIGEDLMSFDLTSGALVWGAMRARIARPGVPR